MAAGISELSGTLQELSHVGRRRAISRIGKIWPVLGSLEVCDGTERQLKTGGVPVKVTTRLYEYAKRNLINT